MEHNVRGSEFRKLCGLNSEGRSSATTTLSLAVLRQLLSFPEQEIPDNARKLLAFSDNRQDASLQAGHFNDFVRVLQLRAGLVAALRARPDQELSLETLALDTEKALRLSADDFIATKGVKPNVEQERRKALRGCWSTGCWWICARAGDSPTPTLSSCGCWRSTTPNW